MGNTIMFSIIVPVYNCEKYIGECINSILAQTYTNYEVIVVDDGSSDNSLAIIRKMAQEKPNIRIVKNAHGGVCKARNTGLELAQGKYLCFVDADDIIYDDYLELLAKAVLNHSPDVIYFHARYGIGDKLCSPDHIQDNKLLGKEDLERLSAASLYHIPELYDPESKLYGISSFSAWGQIYRRELYLQNNIYFTEGITLSEDGLVNLQMLKYAERGVIIPVELYNYRTNNVSATRSYKADMVEIFAKRDNAVKQIVDALYPEAKEAYLLPYYCSLLYELRMISEQCIFHPLNTEHFSEKKSRFLEVIHQPDYQIAISRCGNCYLLSEDLQYLKYAKKESVLHVFMAGYIKRFLNKMKHILKSWLKKAHLDVWVRRVLGR